MTKENTQVATQEPVTDENGNEVDTTTGEIAVFDPSALKMKRRVTLPVLKQRVGIPMYLVFCNAMEMVKFDNSKYEGDPTVCKVYDIVSRAFYQIVVKAVTKSELVTGYPKDSYVGKGFSICLHSVEGKKYKICDIAEFEVPKDIAGIVKAENALE